MNRSDLMALIVGCRTRRRARVVDLCDRFGRETYMTACDALLERTRRAMTRSSSEYIPRRR